MFADRLAAVVTVRCFLLALTGVLLAAPIAATRVHAEEPPATAGAESSESSPEAPPATETKFRKLTNVEYARHGETALLADLFVPNQEGTFPGVLLVHGGAWRHGSKDRYTDLATQLVNRGYSVMAIDYRLAPQHKFPAQLEDCVSALAWLHKNANTYQVDASRVGAWGYSAGGQLVALLGATQPSDRAKFKPAPSLAAEGEAGASGKKMLRKKGDASAHVRLQAVIAGGAPTDFRNWLPAESKVLAYWLGKTRAERPDLYEQASPRHFSSKDDPPMLFYHGENDAIVPIRFGRAMSNDLAKLGVHTAFHLVPNKGHLLARFDEAALIASFAFLDEHLKGKGAAAKADHEKPPATEKK